MHIRRQTTGYLGIMVSLGAGAAAFKLICHVLPQFLHHRLFSVDQDFCHSLSDSSMLAPGGSTSLQRGMLKSSPMRRYPHEGPLRINPINLPRNDEER